MSEVETSSFMIGLCFSVSHIFRRMHRLVQYSEQHEGV
jgi:hypothetical protein